jgi:hypothetical protein
MAVILKSDRKGWLLKIGDPSGTAYIEVNGLTYHLDIPYLWIRYIAGGDSEKVFSGYQIEGWCVSGATKPITTPQLIHILHDLGFSGREIQTLSANSFRKAISDFR